MNQLKPLMESIMIISKLKSILTFFQHLSLYVTVFICVSVIGPAQAATDQMYFQSPEKAIDELVIAIKKDKIGKLIEILGQEAKPVLESGDPVADKAGRAQFVEAYEQFNSLNKISDKLIVLEIGHDHWPFPISLAKDEQGWRFDTAAGKEEIINRRVGQNELSTIQAMLAYVDAQREYYLANPQQYKMNVYAEKLLSSPDKRDGLYYPVEANESPSPLGNLYAQAHEHGYDDDTKSQSGPQPYFGYYFRILNKQGIDAPGGAYDYLVNGKMLGGHALIAWPATYGNSGVMSFIVNHDGEVFEKDFGPNTIMVTEKITVFNPDETWKAVKQEDLNIVE